LEGCQTEGLATVILGGWREVRWERGRWKMKVNCQTVQVRQKKQLELREA